MKLSAPIYRLKRRAKLASREKNIPLHQALDEIAQQEGYRSWGLLAAKAAAATPARTLLSRLTPGDMTLIGARPGHGKTLLGLELIVEAIRDGRRGMFFTLEYTARDVLGHLQGLAGEASALGDRFQFDNSDEISAGYIIDQLRSAPRGTVVVVDYLQLLDQKRRNPDLMTQIRALKSFAEDRGLIVVFISQIDRAYETSGKRLPGLEDVRLPNPLDLSLFDKTCFLHDGEVRIEAAAP